MRVAAEHDGIRVKAYAGTTGVLLGLDVDDRHRDGLLGFAIRRRAGRRAPEWLDGMLPFPGTPHKPGELLPTNVAPVQRFRWQDYRVYPDTSYEYEIHAVSGDYRKPTLTEGPTVKVRTSPVKKGDHVVIFNRAAAASQAFSRKFPQVQAQIDAALKAKQPVPPLPRDVREWLSRGVLEQIVGFLERAKDERWALDIAIYEYELDTIVKAVEAARRRGVKVRVVYHAKPGDSQTALNERNLARLPKACKRGRVTTKICHHKFVVLSKLVRGHRVPQAVLAGSTNFTENGVFRQANVVHVVNEPEVAQKYEALFEVLFRGDDPSQTRVYVDEHDPIDGDAHLFVGFSPRRGGADLKAFVQSVEAARQDVLFCTAFAIYPPLLEALRGAPHDHILRLGLQNSRSKITGLHRDRTAEFVAAAMLNRGLDGFLRETTAGQKGNILIHTKLIVVDFTSEAPTVISGSHNLSQSASQGNDENFLVIRGNTDVADCYGVELMRLYEHYRFRWVAQHPSTRTGASPNGKPAGLRTDDGWTEPYFRDGSLEQRDRLAFSGAPA